MLGMKFVGCIMVILSCTGLGLYCSCTLKARMEELVELKKLLLLLRGDIRYANTPLAEALHSISIRHDGPFHEFFAWVSEQLEQMQGKTIAVIWREGVETKLEEVSLVKKDKDALLAFGNNLGYLDKEMQLSTIDLYVATLETEIDEMTRTVKEKTYLYNSLGVMAGIFLTIVLI